MERMTSDCAANNNIHKDYKLLATCGSKQTMKLKRRPTASGTGTAIIFAFVGLSLSWLILPIWSLSSCLRHSHGHSPPPLIFLNLNLNHRHPSQTDRIARYHHYHCRRAFSIRENEREGEMELELPSDKISDNNESVDADFISSDEKNTMLLDSTLIMMMDSNEDVPVDHAQIVDGDKYENDGKNYGLTEKIEYDRGESPFNSPSPPPLLKNISSSTSSRGNNNDPTIGGNSDASSISSNNNNSSSSNSTERRPSNRRMQVFAYLSKPIVEVRIICLVLLSCFLQAITTLDSLPPYLYGAIDYVDTVCVYIFATEFFARWWSAGRLQLRYLARPLVCIDAIVVILPLILNGLLPLWDFGVVTGFFPPVNLPSWLLAASSANSALLNLRLLRILKFQRVLTDETTYMNFEMALGMKKSEVRPYQLQLARVVISIFTLVSVSTGLIYSAEHEINPQIPDYFTALYFGLTTLTTVGFGDISPVTVSGRFVVGASILAGVAIIPAQAANLAEAYLDFMKERTATNATSTTSSVSRAVKKPTSANAASNMMFGTGRIKDAPTTVRSTSEMKKEVNYCSACGVGSHRIDARFCWSCGKTLE